MLQIRGVGKRFGTRQVLEDVSFDVIEGRMTGFVGGNGAGKTTTMRIILGVLEPDSGDVTLDGKHLGSGDRRGFGYMPEERGLYPKMRLLEQLVYLARLHGLDPDAARTNARELLGRLGLGERENDPLEKLSLGNQQRAQIAAALVHDPAVLVLDEPFSGLDPMGVETVVDVLRERAARGVPVLFSSHQLDIVERLCDDLVIIADGRIRAAGPRADLQAQHASLRYRLVANDTNWLDAFPGVTIADRSADGVLFDADTAETVQKVLAAALARGAVTDFGRQNPTLADIYREIVR
ncbi:MAG: ATP-binding cassette domain-containing protein [Pseudolysinimonas sp.]|uniref:ABC transporter ATP-binding protein n=1 Tax=Pseudolysinimonas sp. TaxID=2680009 RepID=UPI003264C7AB